MPQTTYGFLRLGIKTAAAVLDVQIQGLIEKKEKTPPK